MPCGCDYPEYQESRVNYQDQDVTLREKNKTIDNLMNYLHDLGTKYNDLKHECDKVTQLLCYCSGIIRDASIEVDPRLHEWMDKHDAWDTERTLKTFKKTFPNGIISHDNLLAYFVREAEKVHPLSNWHKTVFFERIWIKYCNWIEDTKKKDLLIEEKTREIERLQKELADLKAEK